MQPIFSEIILKPLSNPENRHFQLRIEKCLSIKDIVSSGPEFSFVGLHYLHSNEPPPIRHFVHLIASPHEYKLARDHCLNPCESRAGFPERLGGCDRWSHHHPILSSRARFPGRKINGGSAWVPAAERFGSRTAASSVLRITPARRAPWTSGGDRFAITHRPKRFISLASLNPTFSVEIDARSKILYRIGEFSPLNFRTQTRMP
jgi:hypothetical protein